MIVCDWCGWRGTGEHDCRASLTHDLLAAYQQLAYLWGQTGSCPCGARRESPATHPHVGGCPTAEAVRMVEASL